MVYLGIECYEGHSKFVDIHELKAYTFISIKRIAQGSKENSSMHFIYSFNQMILGL